jgi:hypothetical protein
VLNAARAILRTLEGAGTDIHELATRIEGGKLSEADMRKIYDAAYQDGQQAQAAEQADEFHNVGPSWHDMAIDAAIMTTGDLPCASANSSRIWFGGPRVGSRPRNRANGCTCSMCAWENGDDQTK